jgi:hypothetical protein
MATTGSHAKRGHGQILGHYRADIPRTCADVTHDALVSHCVSSGGTRGVAADTFFTEVPITSSGTTQRRLLQDLHDGTR